MLKKIFTILLTTITLIGIVFNSLLIPRFINGQVKPIEDNVSLINKHIKSIQTKVNSLEIFSNEYNQAFVDFTYYRMFIKKKLVLSLELNLDNKITIEKYIDLIASEFVDLVKKNEKLVPFLNDFSTISVFQIENNRIIEVIYKYRENDQKFYFSRRIY